MVLLLLPPTLHTLSLTQHPSTPFSFQSFRATNAELQNQLSATERSSQRLQQEVRIAEHSASRAATQSSAVQSKLRAAQANLKELQQVREKLAKPSVRALGAGGGRFNQ